MEDGFVGKQQCADKLPASTAASGTELGACPSGVQRAVATGASFPHSTCFDLEQVDLYQKPVLKSS